MGEPSITNTVWSSDRDRALAILGAPAAVRNALAAVLAFNADLGAIQWQVSEPLIGRMRFQWWRDALDGVCSGTPPVHMTAEALSRACVAHGISASALEEVVDAREAAFLAEAPETLDVLESRVGAIDGAVFRLMAQIVAGPPGSAAVRAAGALGTAWGLIGTVRAVPLWATARRTALPTDLCRAGALDIDTHFTNGAVPELPRVIGPIIDRAAVRLAEARSERTAVPKATHPAFASAIVADGHLARLRGAGYNPFDARVQAKTLGPGTSLRLWWAGIGGGY